MTWLEDSNGNKCSVEYFGTEEAARAALDSLKNCDNCINCSRCSGCSGCSDCSGCLGCSDCSRLQGAKPVESTDGAGAPAVPIIPNIHARVYEAVSQPHALDMSSWHTCETTHCRAGWVVTLAGEEGEALVAFHNTDLAARLIYAASGYEIHPARFHDNSEKAMEDMRRLAEEEAAKD